MSDESKQRVRGLSKGNVRAIVLVGALLVGGFGELVGLGFGSWWVFFWTWLVVAPFAVWGADWAFKKGLEGAEAEANGCD